jgi:hypothetical protein
VPKIINSGSKKRQMVGFLNVCQIRTNERKEEMRRKNKLLVCNIGLGGAEVISSIMAKLEMAKREIFLM